MAALLWCKMLHVLIHAAYAAIFAAILAYIVWLGFNAIDNALHMAGV